jgi:hypothetical protein
MIHRPKFIITIGEHFFLDKPIHMQIAKFYCRKFEEKSMRDNFFSKSMHSNLKTPEKIPAGSHCTVFKSR